MTINKTEARQFKELLKPLQFKYITTNQQLAEVCRKASHSNAVALDTEFVRRKTFYANLGLIQLYDGETLSLIDPLTINDFQPFKSLLANEKVIKVLHASSEDLEIFQHYFSQLPTPLVDTQILADFIGLKSGNGFAKLVEHFFSLELDKGASQTDWLARPLSDEQCHYAACDVWYLIPLYKVMIEQFPAQWHSAFAEENQLLINKYQRELDTENIYLNVKQAWRLEGRHLLCLKLLSQWRVEQAIRRNLPQSFVLRDEKLIEICQKLPRHSSELLELGLNPTMVRINGQRILLLIKRALQAQSSEYPEVIEQINKLPQYNKIMKKLKAAIAEIAPENIDNSTLASKKILHQLLRWQHKGENQAKLPLLLTGWRKPYGEKLLSVLKA